MSEDTLIGGFDAARLPKYACEHLRRKEQQIESLRKELATAKSLLDNTEKSSVIADPYGRKQYLLPSDTVRFLTPTGWIDVKAQSEGILVRSEALSSGMKICPQGSNSVIIRS